MKSLRVRECCGCAISLSHITIYLFHDIKSFFLTLIFFIVVGTEWITSWGLVDDTTVCVVNLEHIGEMIPFMHEQE